MNLPMTPMTPRRATLQLKKGPDAAPPAVAAPVGTPPRPARPDAQKERRRLDNIALSAQASARKRADLEKVAPLLTAYLAGLPALTRTVEVDGAACLRPLAVGVRHAVAAWLRAQPQTAGCSATTLNELISLALKAHVGKPAYLAGILSFNERFDLDGQKCGAVTDKHKAHATKRQELKA